MAKTYNEEQAQALVAKALVKNTKAVLKSVGEAVKSHIASAGEIEDRAAKKVVVTALKAVAVDIKSIAA